MQDIVGSRRPGTWIRDLGSETWDLGPGSWNPEVNSSWNVCSPASFTAPLLEAEKQCSRCLVGILSRNNSDGI
ncbi:hypothetical protein F2Q68_00025194 [Brassica cretica]|uniref:Uncharacterized protein n=1 Tax=Brassica cretica TaxID=69181 RepID=A0A8S9I6F5_BRACR|nr:hypothetical protein F2Q68_00025194 [Brassica cretica]